VGRPVIVHLSSKDVIHSFGLPQMRVKQDAIPSVEQRLWFTPTKTGEWEIACSQLCGLGHYRMRGLYTVQTQADSTPGSQANQRDSDLAGRLPAP
jgi:cytochrome c oxidase subunit 2